MTTQESAVGRMKKAATLLHSLEKKKKECLHDRRLKAEKLGAQHVKC